MSVYSKKFYSENAKISYRSAREIVPLILKLFRPKSIVDIGCSSGMWLNCFQEYGIKDYLGVDYLGQNKLSLNINKKHFLEHNLKSPIHLKRKFDLVISLEVAEHLPANKASIFINSLVELGPVIIFSAAVPHQTGTHHVNEQWPSYWAKLFSKHNYIPFDYFRKKIWKNEKIEWWYRQNLLIYINRKHFESHLQLKTRLGKSVKIPIARIHPQNWTTIKHTKKLDRFYRWILNKIGL